MGKVVIGILFLGQIRLYQVIFGTHGWLMTLAYTALAFTVTLATGICGWAVRDTWPLAVPYDFKPVLDAYKGTGWRTTRVHPWWRCKLDRSDPHVHIIMPRKAREGSRIVPVSAGTSIRLPEISRESCRLRLTKSDKAPDGVLASKE